MTEIEKALVKESVYRHYCLRYTRAKKAMEFYEIEMLMLRGELNSSSGQPIWDLVIADMHARDAVGRLRYGTPLQAHNGRDALVDAYEEALDLAVYLKQAIVERDLLKEAPGTPPSV